MTYKLNDIVVIHNLIKRPELNNISGIICTGLTNGRYGILLDNHAIGMLFKIENIKSNSQIEIINKQQIEQTITNLENNFNTISDNLNDIRGKLDIMKHKTITLHNKYHNKYHNKWCLHPDCLTSIECFQNNTDLYNHMKSH